MKQYAAVLRYRPDKKGEVSGYNIIVETILSFILAVIYRLSCVLVGNQVLLFVRFKFELKNVVLFATNTTHIEQ